MSHSELDELLRRRMELPPQLTPLTPPWMNETLQLLISVGRKLDEIVKHLEKVEKAIEELKTLIISKT